MEKRELIFKIYYSLTMLLYYTDNHQPTEDEYNNLLYLLDRYLYCTEVKSNTLTYYDIKNKQNISVDLKSKED